MALRLVYLAVLRVFGWLSLLARADRAKDAEIRTALSGDPEFGVTCGDDRAIRAVSGVTRGA